MVAPPRLRLLIITAYCSLLCCCITIDYVCEAAPTQNFSISFAALSQATPLVLEEYGGMESYVAYMGESASAGGPSSWLVFIPAAATSRSYILSILVFSQPPQNTKGTIVWMANRNNPVSGNFSLSLDQPSGYLLLHDGNGSLAWSSNYSTTATSAAPAGAAVSMDLTTDPIFKPPIGTLVISDANNVTLWKSSDSPASLTSLMAFSDFSAGQRMVSWASPEDPSEGLYSLVMEVGGLALYYNAFPSPQPYWIWSYYEVLNTTFNVTHTCRNLTSASILTEGAIQLSQGSVEASPNSTWPALCSANSSTDHTLMEFDFYGSEGTNEVTFLQLEYDGNLKAYTIGTSRSQRFDLFDGNNCLLPNHCGPYGICTAPNSNCACPSSSDGSFPSAFPSNQSEGCPPTRSLSCLNAIDSLQGQQEFLALEGVDYFSNMYTTPLNFSTQESCTAACLQECSCLAAFWHVHSSSCFHADHLGSLQGSLNTSYLAFLKVEHISQPDLRRRLIIIGVASGVAALLILSLLAACIYIRRRRAALTADEEDPFWTSTPGLPTRYSYKDLQSITNGFSEQMGKGGFGAVYAGTLPNGTKVAVKRLESLRQGKKEFRAEVVILGGIHHYNLVDLIGFCAEGSHRLLVYEFLAKSSLDQWLFEPATPLSWKNRYNIAIGAARGLAYLHGGCKETIIHLDIKPENILLDEDFVAKVSDFGLSTLMARNETHVVTNMRGTPGYLAPEWISAGCVISEKCDVFSFGKLLMEILGARRNLDTSLVEADKVYFPSWLYHQVAAEGDGKAADRLAQIAMVETREELKQARLMMNTAFLCILESPDMRPSMEKVVQMLQGQAPDLENLQPSDLFQGLHFSLRTPTPDLAQARMAEALASIYSTVSGVHDHISAR